jgi:Methyltransferase domain
VVGWFSATAGLGMNEILWHQEERGVRGNLAEIGIHHGKSFLVLAGAARSSETVFAIDVFERQELNLDHSGCGNRVIFESHLKRFLPGAKISVIAESSADLRGREAALGLAGLRFVSIDGGHTRELTLNDLQIADGCLVDGGVCCVDDVFNAHWPGVVSGLFDFLDQDNRLVPPACFPDKLFLCGPAWKPPFLAHTTSRCGYAMARADLLLRDSTMDVVGDRWPSMGGSLDQLAAELTAARASSRPSRGPPRRSGRRPRRSACWRRRGKARPGA